MANLILVEGESDKHFIEAFIRHIKISTPTKVSDACICSVDEVECLGGLSSTSVARALGGLKGGIRKGGIEKLGIIVDVDDKKEEERLILVNTAIEEVFGVAGLLKEVGVLEDLPVDQHQTIKVGCYLTNINGKGELETVLRTIKGKASDYGDCLEAWRACLKSKGKVVKQKDFDKLWVQMYIRYDTCSKTDRKQAMKNCCFKASLEKNEVWDLSHSCLEVLRAFLLQFN
jgi:hypothetical protein